MWIRWSIVVFTFALAGTASAEQRTSPEDFDPTPRPEVREGVERQRGGGPDLFRQTYEANREYDRYRQYDPKIQRKSESVTLTRNELTLPFELEVSQGYITTLTFLDANGNPYPTRISRVGDNTTFVVCTGISDNCQAGEEDLDIAHILTVGTTRLAGRSNLRVFFRGLDRAVQIPLVGRKGSYHDEVIVMLPVTNPDAPSPAQLQDTRLTIPETDDYVARALIDGVPATRLGDGVDLQVEVRTRTRQRLPTGQYAAIYVNGKTYLRTDITLPNPGAEAITPGPMNQVVYRFNGRPRFVSGFNRHGQIVKIELKAPENVLGYREYRRDGR
ncbi:DotH/IcmK family type IV secretion protein [Marinimicrobium sp. ABcell2]|uniref:DotH/IcmK family type IV secretion protein n=1 Tax=Marinimicrobium sp. ABcell2 TaxID=3069751 RepID=UPI0027B2AE9D|nr:DotH/IcmK family type IV secretion protein [Marinimicrobium sp. ABcell2]MDQ2077399.1 DotH/IcmK family type IV secretion protein [Marinimicrobium sp. ABcell2]